MRPAQLPSHLRGVFSARHVPARITRPALTSVQEPSPAFGRPGRVRPVQVPCRTSCGPMVATHVPWKTGAGCHPNVPVETRSARTSQTFLTRVPFFDASRYIHPHAPQGKGLRSFCASPQWSGFLRRALEFRRGTPKAAWRRTHGRVYCCGFSVYGMFGD